MGIPPRLIGGLVSMEGMGFRYHSRAESYEEGWIAVDPTLNQVGVDAAHVKLVDGPFLTLTLRRRQVVGRVKAGVIDYRALCKQLHTVAPISAVSIFRRGGVGP